ncbi:MAG: ATP phosphoribosyltransferase regulatory subunit [Piscinibacter sp.]|nr:ATP phosphoribosyltransferase regulatory subunit [Piscinibacter sp.]
MSSAWLLPEHIADVLPAQARHIEELRRGLLDVARSFGCELVMPPLMEHIESLLSGTGRDLDLKTFKLVDQLSGRTLGVRADSTPQVARIDAHLLNREGVTRLCYCGPVLHTRPRGMQATREPLQFGAEIYGHAGLEADIEVQDLALDCLSGAGLPDPALDLADARIVRALLAGVDRVRRCAGMQRWPAGRPAALADCAPACPMPCAVRCACLSMAAARLLAEARRKLPDLPPVRAALDDLGTLARHARQAHPQVRVGFDLADVGGSSYYSGARFAIYAKGSSDAVARGGRYDEVGAIFGRNRPAVGFSLDIKELAELVPGRGGRPAVRAPWSEDAGLRVAVRRLREQGETVVCVLPGHEHEGQEFECDRELVAVAGQWAVRAL